MVVSCGVAQLVPDTRFLGENTLQYFFESLILAAEIGDGFVQPPSSSATVNGESIPEIEISMNRRKDVGVIESELEASISELSGLLSVSLRSRISASSVSWLENLIAEASLRNRDRLSVLWRLLSQHYEMTIQNAVVLTYSLER